MCCCGKRTLNGTLGYKWNEPSGAGSVYPVNAPEIREDEAIVYDEPGRCCPVVNGKTYRIDHHSHHYRLVKDKIGSYRLLVRHGGGAEEIGDAYNIKCFVQFMESMDSDSRFVFFMSLDSVTKDAARTAGEKSSAYWRKAAAEKRIKTRKCRGSDVIKVWIE